MAVNVTVTYTNHTKEKVEIITPDLIRYEMHAQRRGWGKITDNPILSNAFSTWSALKRTGKYSEDFDEWLNTVADISPDQDSVDSDPLAEAAGHAN